MSDHEHQFEDWMEDAGNGRLRGGYRCRVCKKTPVDVRREAKAERAIVLAWLARPEVERVVSRVLRDRDIIGCPDVSISECVIYALRQFAEQDGPLP